MRFTTNSSEESGFHFFSEIARKDRYDSDMIMKCSDALKADE